MGINGKNTRDSLQAKVGNFQLQIVEYGEEGINFYIWIGGMVMLQCGHMRIVRPSSPQGPGIPPCEVARYVPEGQYCSVIVEDDMG